jgi:uncharacterized RDD family membrane protein YckC
MATVPDVAGRGRAQPAVVSVMPRTVIATGGYACLVTRTLGAAVDALVIDVVALFIAAVVALVLSIFPVPGETKTVLAVIGGVLFAVWVIAYFVTFWTTTGQTPGDRVMRIQVLREDGKTLGPWRAALRLAGAVIGLILFIGYIPILLNDRRRALHDWMAGTVVIEAQPRGTP